MGVSSGSPDGRGASASLGTSTSDQRVEAQLNNELSVLEQQPSTPGSGDLNLTGGGGGYSFSPSELDEVIARWQQVRYQADVFDETIRTIMTTTTAAMDDASTAFTSRARQVGTNVLASHSSLKDYITAYIGKLQTARNNYTDTEQAIADSFASVSEDLGR